MESRLFYVLWLCRSASQSTSETCQRTRPWKPQDAKLSEIRQPLEYQQQLGSMLAYVGPKLRRQLKAELTMLEDQIKTLRSEIHSGGRNRLGRMS